MTAEILISLIPTEELHLVESKGLLYIGTGVSGGEEGALLGPSIMPGGSKAAWPFVKPIFQAIAAKVDDGLPAVTGLEKTEQDIL